MKLVVGDDGKICVWGTSDRIPGFEYTGTIPADFYEFVGLGKYKYEGGSIVEVGGWVMPADKALEQVNDFMPEVIS